MMFNKITSIHNTTNFESSWKRVIHRMVRKTVKKYWNQRIQQELEETLTFCRDRKRLRSDLKLNIEPVKIPKAQQIIKTLKEKYKSEMEKQIEEEFVIALKSQWAMNIKNQMGVKVNAVSNNTEDELSKLQEDFKVRPVVLSNISLPDQNHNFILFLVFSEIIQFLKVNWYKIIYLDNFGCFWIEKSDIIKKISENQTKILYDQKKLCFSEDINIKNNKFLINQEQFLLKISEKYAINHKNLCSIFNEIMDVLNKNSLIEMDSFGKFQNKTFIVDGIIDEYLNN